MKKQQRQQQQPQPLPAPPKKQQQEKNQMPYADLHNLRRNHTSTDTHPAIFPISPSLLILCFSPGSSTPNVLP